MVPDIVAYAVTSPSPWLSLFVYGINNMATTGASETVSK